MNTTRIIVVIFILSSISVFAQKRNIAIKCIIGSGKDAISMPELNSPLAISIAREVAFPTEWDLPSQQPTEYGLIYTPARPTAFVIAKSGWEIHCSADTVGKLIRLKGSAIFTEVKMNKGLYGEQSGPLHLPGSKALLENKAETASTLSSTSHFQLFAIPGKEYKIKIRRLNKWISCRIICNFETK